MGEGVLLPSHIREKVVSQIEHSISLSITFSTPKSAKFFTIAEDKKAPKPLNMVSTDTVSITKLVITPPYLTLPYLPVLARFSPVLLNGDMLGLILGLSSLRVPFSNASSLSCCFLY